MATDKISSPLDRLVDENNKKNLKISRKHSKDVYIWCYIQLLWITLREFALKNQNRLISRK
jgi:hypothetical protein